MAVFERQRQQDFHNQLSPQESNPKNHATPHDAAGTNRKPEQTMNQETRGVIETLYPKGNRIGLFRRGTAPEGWSVWGNEAG